jgi:CPA1 family monovalent cation:H+ antiporter
VLDGVLVSAIVILVRFLWVYPATYLPRWLFPSIAARDPTPPWRFPFVIAFTGVRGVVSSPRRSIPIAVATNVPFPARDRVLVPHVRRHRRDARCAGAPLPWVLRKLGSTSWARRDAPPQPARGERADRTAAPLARLETIAKEQEPARRSHQPVARARARLHRPNSKPSAIRR